jgi:hypothetical protein
MRSANVWRMANSDRGAVNHNGAQRVRSVHQIKVAIPKPQLMSVCFRGLKW